MKVCKKCGEEKEIEFFGKNKSKKDGIDIYCKECNILKSKNYKQNHEEYYKEYYKKWIEENKEYKRTKDKEYYTNNKESVRNKVKEYCQKNKEKVSDNSKKYREENKDYYRIYNKKYREENKEKIKNHIRVYRRNKRHNDSFYKLKDSLRHRIYMVLKSKKFSKKSKTEEILGCSFIEFKIYIESKFESWMSWENYGKYNGDFNFGWDIDHIIPLDSANSEYELLKLCRYANLQPLCSYTNRYIKINLI